MKSAKQHLIGSGTYGKVFLLDKNKIRKDMDILDESSEFLSTTINECAFISTFSNVPFIAHKVSVTIQNKQLFLVQTNAGIDLHKYIKISSYRRRLSLLPRLICQLSRILIWMKKVRVAHMDIKPQNLCIKDGHMITLVDWGFVTPVHQYSNVSCGTYSFADPTYICSEKKATYAYDMFSVGMVLVYYLSREFIDREKWVKLGESPSQEAVLDLMKIFRHKNSIIKCCPNGGRIFDIILRMLEINEHLRIKPLELYTQSIFSDLWADYPISEMGEIIEFPVIDQIINIQDDINHKMMVILIDWLIDVNTHFHLKSSLGHTIKLVYRFLGKKLITRKELQLVSICCLYLSTMIQQSDMISLSDLIYISDNAYTECECIVMIQIILQTLNWEIFPIKGCAETYLRHKLQKKQWKKLYLERNVMTEFAFLPEDIKIGVLHQNGLDLYKIE